MSRTQKVERGRRETVQEDLEASDNYSESESGSGSGSGSYEEIDVTENPLYQVLSAFFEDEEGDTVCDHFKAISERLQEQIGAIQEQTKAIHELAVALKTVHKK